MDYAKYQIQRRETDELHPEETLADSVNEHSLVEAPIGQGVFRVFYFLAGLLVIAVLAKAVQLQAMEGGRHALTAARNSYANYLGPAFRGLIYDRNGQPLVENIPVFDLIAYHQDLPTGEQLTAAVDELSRILALPADALQKQFADNRAAAVWLVKGDLDKNTVARLEVADLPGLYVVANARRYYPAGGGLGGVLGYTAKVNAEDIRQDGYYRLTDRIGRFGLEQYYEEELRGDHRRIALKAAPAAPEDSQPGHDLILNIDNAIQTQLYRAMLNVLTPAGLKRGAAVAQDPRTGAVLALVSLPAFDPNLFENSSDPANAAKINQLLQDRQRPLFNRAVGGRYSPGSTIKPLLAAAGLKEGVVTPETKVMANGSITIRSVFDPKVSFTFNDWKVHGLTDLKKAIADSVDVYFYALGGGWGNSKGLGVEKIVSYFKELWADRPLGIDLPGESAGFVPTPEWKQATRGEGWFIGDTYNVSIGQGDLGVTPLWLNGYLGAIANGRTLFQPQLVKGIKDGAGQTISERQPLALAELPFDAQVLNTVREGMRQAVTAGTAVALNDLPQPVAAKTGTAQVGGQKLNSLFIVYGPYNNPTIAVTILVEHVSGQGLAIRAADEFLQWYFTK